MFTLGVIALIAGAVIGTAAGAINVATGLTEAAETQSDIQTLIDNQNTNLQTALDSAALAWEQQVDAAGDQADDWLYQAGLLKEDSLEYAAQSGALGVKTTKDESILSTVYNQAINEIQLTAEKNQLSNQIASVEQGKSIGGALAGMAKSGIRSGSSAHDALGNEQTLYDKSMEINLTGQSNDLDSTTINSYANLHNGLNTLTGQRTQQKNLITQSERAANMSEMYEDRANDLLSEYEEGGLQWRIHQQRLREVQNAYDQNMANLLDQYGDAQYSFWDGVTDYFTGAQVGQTVGNNVSSFLTDFGSFLD